MLCLYINNNEDEFYSHTPDNHVIVTDINKNHQTINKTKLNINSRDCNMRIGNVDFFCELLTRKEDDAVLLMVEYEDPDSMIIKEHLNKFVKFVEIMILGFMNHFTDYEEKPEEFFKVNIHNSNKWMEADGAW